MAGASDDRYGDPVLRQLAELSVRLAGTNGLLLHATYVQYIGALADGTLLLQVDDGADSDPEDDPIPPWPAAGEEIRSRNRSGGTPTRFAGSPSRT